MANKYKTAYKATQEYRAAKIAHEEATLNSGNNILEIADAIAILGKALKTHQQTLDSHNGAFEEIGEVSTENSNFILDTLGQILYLGHGH